LAAKSAKEIHLEANLMSESKSAFNVVSMGTRRWNVKS
jgi:hypothetical protein